MKKMFFVLAILLFVGTGCFTNTNEANNETKITTTQSTPLLANDYVNKLKTAGLPIGTTIVYTAETDTNNLMGRPNQYTSKVNFSDTTIEQISESEPIGGSIEVFVNSTDAKARKDYIDNIGKNSPLFVEYSFINGNALLRLNKNLTPAQVEKYKAEFNKIK